MKKLGYRLVSCGIAVFAFAQMITQEASADVECDLPLYYKLGIMGLGFEDFTSRYMSWHQYANKGCGKEASLLIQNYLSSNSGKLSKIEVRELNQLRATLENIKTTS